MAADGAREGYAKLGGLSFRYRDWGGPSTGSGRGNDGPALLLLHGLASTARIWDLTAPLLRAGARVVAMDQRGHGASDKPDHGYDYETLVGDALGLLDHLDAERAVIVGHSWGASVALNAAAQSPDRVAAVVLLDGGFGDLGARMTWVEAAQRLAPPDLTQLTPADLLERIRSHTPLDLSRPEIAEVILANFAVGEDGHIRPHLTRERHLRIVRAMWEQRSSELYPRVDVPVLLAPARSNDANLSDFQRMKAENVARALELLPDGRAVWFEDSIHDVPLQRPELVAETILAFVRESLG